MGRLTRLSTRRSHTSEGHIPVTSCRFDDRDIRRDQVSSSDIDGGNFWRDDNRTYFKSGEINCLIMRLAVAFEGGDSRGDPGP